MPEFFNRPPRIQPELPEGEIEIPGPPSEDENGGQNLIQLFLPFVTIAGYLAVSASGGRGNATFMIPMALSVTATAGMGFYQFWLRNRDKNLKRAAYMQRLASMRNDMLDSHDKQRIFYTYNYPEPDVNMTMAGSSNNRNFRLWERRTTDADFGALRIGMGTRTSTIVYKTGSSLSSDSPLVGDTIKLADDSRLVDNIPITIALRPPFMPEGKQEDREEGEDGKKPVPSRHTVGIAGSNRVLVGDAIRAMMVSLSAAHSPTDVRIYVLGGADAQSAWKWARWLPHSNSSRSGSGDGDQLGFEPRERRRLWDGLQAELERRQLRRADRATFEITLPFIVVVIDALADADALKEAESEAALSIILREGPLLGAAIIFAVPDRNTIPSDVEAVLEIESAEREQAFRYAEVGVNTLRYDGVVDRVDVTRAENEFARRLAPLAVRTVGGADIANAVSLLELFTAYEERANNPYLDVNELGVLAKWANSKLPKSADWLRVPVGLMIGNKVRDLVFAADGDGVHGLAAGTTGSGKSELLLTIITGLAIRYDPSIVNFVMVDFKGGAAFEPFRSLPHTVDIVTNLQGTAGARTFVALRSELNRRSKLIADTNTKHIVHYRQKNLHLDREPFPHLYVIIDEFAEMVKEMPEFKGHLDSIARLGRALGVHLLLATQRPSGVVSDQMRANMKFRICLRVETPEDSRELLRRSDAAFLPPNIPGRAYLQVGNENVELMQVARAGGPYTGKLSDGDSNSPAVEWPNRKKKVDPAIANKSSAEAPALSDVVVEVCRRFADDPANGVVRQEKPWPDPLPTRFALADVFNAKYMRNTETETAQLNPALEAWINDAGAWKGLKWQQEAMRTDIGLIDNPIRAEQLPLSVELNKGHAVVFSASGWGKTTFLRSVIMGLCATHSPADLNIYMLDFGGRGLDVLSDLPHVIATVLPSEEERVTRLLRRVGNVLEERRNLLSAARADNVFIYNDQHPDKALPSLLVVIDNFAEFRENYESYIEGLISLVRDGRSYGVFFLLSGQLTGNVPGKLYNLFTERYALRMADAGEYSNVVGRNVQDMGEIAGRGYVAMDRVPLEFQCAMPITATEEETEAGLDDTKKLAQIVDRMRQAWNKPKTAQPIEVLRPVISLKSMLPERPRGKNVTILGMEDQNLDLATVDLPQRGPHFVVIGPPLSGKTTALRTWVMSTAQMYSPDQVLLVLVDFQQRFFKYGGKRTLGDLPQVYAAISDAKELEAVIAEIRKEFETPRAADLPPRPEIFFISDNYDDYAAVIGSSTMSKSTVYKDLAELGRKYGPDGFHMVIAGTMALMRGSDDFIKQALASRYGLGLDASDAPSALGGRARATATEFPPGRGYVVKAGRMSLIQVATPQGEGTLEESLDTWVDEIAARYPQRTRLAKDFVEVAPPEPEPTSTEPTSVEPTSPEPAPGD